MSTTAFGEWLQNVLIVKEMTGAQLARKMRVDKSAVYRILSGERRVGRKLAPRMARALDLPEADFYAVAFGGRGATDPAKFKSMTAREITRLVREMDEAGDEKSLDGALQLIKIARDLRGGFGRE